MPSCRRLSSAATMGLMVHTSARFDKSVSRELPPLPRHDLPLHRPDHGVVYLEVWLLVRTSLCAHDPHGCIGVPHVHRTCTGGNGRGEKDTRHLFRTLADKNLDGLGTRR